MPASGTPSWCRPSTTPSTWSWGRRRTASRTCCRSGTGGCSPRRSPSTAGRRSSWPTTWPRVRGPRSRPRCAATRTSATSASTGRRSGGWSSTSTTSTRRWTGPFEWDVKRLAASVELAAAGQRLPGEAAARDRRAVRPRIPGGHAHLREPAHAGRLVRPRHRADGRPASCSTPSTSPAARRSPGPSTRPGRATASVRGASWPRWSTAGCAWSADPRCSSRAGTSTSDPGRRRWSEWITTLIDEYATTLSTNRRQLLQQYRFVDIALKVVGVGSVGTRSWVVLMVGRDEEDPLFLQAKEAVRSVLDVALGSRALDHHGQRVVEGQRIMQAVSDVLLGWQRATRRRRQHRLLRAPAAGLEGRRWRSRASRRRSSNGMRGSAPRPWLAPMRGPATASPSPPTSAVATPSTTRSASSPRPTPTRPRPTTPPCSRRPATDGSRPSTTSSRSPPRVPPWLDGDGDRGRHRRATSPGSTTRPTPTSAATTSATLRCSTTRDDYTLMPPYGGETRRGFGLDREGHRGGRPVLRRPARPPSTSSTGTRRETSSSSPRSSGSTARSGTCRTRTCRCG